MIARIAHKALDVTDRVRETARDAGPVMAVLMVAVSLVAGTAVWLVSRDDEPTPTNSTLAITEPRVPPPATGSVGSAHAPTRHRNARGEPEGNATKPASPEPAMPSQDEADGNRSAGGGGGGGQRARDKSQPAAASDAPANAQQVLGHALELAGFENVPLNPDGSIELDHAALPPELLPPGVEPMPQASGSGN